ncbi:MAG: helicase-related protein, partial [Firmicutes bacterium]|nr:helicase-related protein [Bacillota bacterium]
MTGTLAGGYASSLHYLLFALDPQLMKDMGFEYRSVQQFVNTYGVLRRVIVTDAGEVFNKSSRGADESVRLKELPGVSLKLFSRHLLDSTAFINLEDIADGLPPYDEYVEIVEMTPDQRAAYDALESSLKSAIGRSGPKASAQYLQTLLAYPDRPFGNPQILDRQTGRVVAKPVELPQNRIYPKEDALLSIIRDEVGKGRRVYVYVKFTNKKDVTARLEQVIRDAGYRVRVLRASVPPEKREGWLSHAVARGCQVVVGNADLVKTGLDLYDFPTLVFYQTGYNLFTLRQAARRSWRIGQKNPVKVVFMAYKETLQDAALRLMGGKLRAALAIEGKFSAEGLRALAQGDDMGAALAKALMEGLERLESAETYWRKARAASAGRDILAGYSGWSFVEVAARSRRRKRVIPGVYQLAWDFNCIGQQPLHPEPSASPPRKARASTQEGLA